MVQCTQCNSELDEDFGLVTCQNCGAQLLIEMDGQVVDAHSNESNQSAEPAQEEASSDAFSAVQELTQNMLSELDENNQTADVFDSPQAEESSPEELEGFDENQEMVSEEPVQEPENQWDLEQEVSYPEQDQEEFEEPQDSPSVAQEMEPPVQQNISEPVEDSVIQESWPEEESHHPNDMMQEIQDFANSDESALEQGALLYDIRIQGIDTKELRGEILEYLNDSKLGLDLESLKIDQGTLIVKSLNPVVVSVIAQRLKPLPIVLDWRQHAAYS
ncbi:MAG: hypothetical protein MK008_06460 [Bdellovibrionales bacterium]|nr:hypothetical protein [Bdellovibrionales bacterium]